MKLKTRVAFIVSSILILQGCLSTQSFELAKDLNTTNEKMNQLLTTAIIEKNIKPKNKISLLAAYSHDAATSAAKKGENKLALGYYRIAATGYWRDDNPDNNRMLFDVVNSAEEICKELDSKAPDRDCFVLRFTPLFASLEDAMKQGKKFDLGATAAEINKGLLRLKDIGFKEKNSVVYNNGAFTNLLNQMIKQQKFLKQHSSLNSYICKNINDTFYSYLSMVFSYRGHLANKPEAEILLNDNPFYDEFIKLKPQKNETRLAKSKRYISTKLPSCKVKTSTE
jgi:hypothetical protein